MPHEYDLPVQPRHTMASTGEGAHISYWKLAHRRAPSGPRPPGRNQNGVRGRMAIGITFISATQRNGTWATTTVNAAGTVTRPAHPRSVEGCTSWAWG